MQNVQFTGDFLILLILLVPVCLLERHWWSLYPFCIFNTIIVHIGYIFVENGRNVLCLCFYIQFVWSWKINKYNINEVHIDSYAFYMFHILEQIYEKILLLCVLILKGHCQVMWANYWCGVFLHVVTLLLVCVLNESEWYVVCPHQKHLRSWKEEFLERWPYVHIACKQF